MFDIITIVLLFFNLYYPTSEYHLQAEIKLISGEYHDAIMLYDKGCRKNEDRSCLKLADFYYEGKHLTKDRVRALELYSKACNSEFLYLDCYNYADMYFKGDGVPRDISFAINVFESSCNGGSDKSCYKLGVINRDGIDVKKDINKAIDYFYRGCEYGKDRTACIEANKLQDILDRNIVITQNPSKY